MIGLAIRARDRVRHRWACDLFILDCLEAEGLGRSMAAAVLRLRLAALDLLDGVLKGWARG